MAYCLNMRRRSAAQGQPGGRDRLQGHQHQEQPAAHGQPTLPVDDVAAVNAHQSGGDTAVPQSDPADLAPADLPAGPGVVVQRLSPVSGLEADRLRAEGIHGAEGGTPPLPRLPHDLVLPLTPDRAPLSACPQPSPLLLHPL